MNSFTKLSLVLSFCYSIISCKSQSQGLGNEDEKIHQVFTTWKSDVLQAGTFVEVCPTSEEFEEMSDTSKRNRLSQAHILPKNYLLSFGDYNGDNKKDALYSFPDYLCTSNALGASPGWLINRSGGFVLITSNYEGYTVSNKELDFHVIENAIIKQIKANRISISLNKIYGPRTLSGTCKIWSDVDKGGKGDCCPDKLFFVTINADEGKTWLHINEFENEAEYEISYR